MFKEYMETDQNQDYKRLTAWQKSLELVFAIEKLTGYFPNLANYGSISQIRRYSISISKIIASGKKTGNLKSFHESLVRAQQICLELDVKIRDIKKLPFGKSLDFTLINNLLNELMAELNTLIRRVQDELE